jgi:hypothetical protein
MNLQESDDIPIERGCGNRTANGVYITSRLAQVGTPWWAFLIDPPIQIDPVTESALGLTDRGVKIIKRPDSEIYDVWDIVGQGSSPDPRKGKGYYNVCDFAIEVAHGGASRKVAPNLPLHLLHSGQSRLLLLHRRACLKYADQYFDHIGTWMSPDWHCLAHRAEHMNPQTRPEMCAGLWCHDVEGGEPVDASVQWHNLHGGLNANPQHVSRLKPVMRHMPAFSYAGWARPEHITPGYGLGIFMTLPISGLDVIKGDKQDEILKRIEQCELDVRLCAA